MGLIPTLAFRFIRSRQSDGFISLISWISIAGVLLGVTALIVVTSVINGFEAELVRSITSLNSHVFVFSRAQAVGGPDQIEARIREISPAVRAVSRSFISELMVGGPHGVSGAVVEGFDAATYGLVTRVPDSVKSGRLPQSGDEVAIGESLAQKIGAEVGGKIRMIAPFSGENGDSDAPKSREATVTGIIKVGMHQFDSKFLFAPLPSVQDFFEQPGRVTSFKIKLAEGADARETARRLADTLGFPFRAKDWSQMNSSLFYAIELEKVVISILLTAIILVAAFNMVSTLMMLIHDKIREISILKAMGLARRAQFSLFCLIGMGIGIVGVVFGTVLGLGLNEIMDKTHLVQLPPDIYQIAFLPVVFRWSEIGWIAVFAFLICVCAAIYPAVQVVRKSPLEGIRNE